MMFDVALEKVVTLINRQDRIGTMAVGKAMVALYHRQTSDEQVGETARVQNGRGFNRWDAKKGTYYARWVLSGKELSGLHLEKARKMAYKYRKQLAEETMLTWEKRASERREEVTPPTLRSHEVEKQIKTNRMGSRVVIATIL